MNVRIDRQIHHPPVSMRRTEDPKPVKQAEFYSARTIAVVSTLALGTLWAIAQILKQPPPELPIPPIQCNPDFGIQDYIEKVKQKDAEAAYCLAQMYFTGENGAKRSPLDAVHLFKLAACGSKQAAKELKELKNRVCQQLFTDTLDPKDHLLAIDLCAPIDCLCICQPYPIYSEPNGLDNSKLVEETLKDYKIFWNGMDTFFKESDIGDSCDSINTKDTWSTESDWPSRVRSGYQRCQNGWHSA